MSASEVAKRYAKGWLSAAKDKNSLDSVAGDTKALSGMIASSPELRLFLASPLASQNHQTKAMTAIAQKAGLNATTTNMLGVLIENRRLNLLAQVLDAAQAAFDAASGTAKAQVTSATPLDEKRVADIRNSLSKKLGQVLAIETKVDPEIIGGLVVRVGSILIDDSVKTKLERMARRLQGQAA